MTVGEQTSGVTVKLTVCCPFVWLTVGELIDPPPAVIVNADALVLGKSPVPMIVTAVAVPPGPEDGEVLAEIVGTLTVNVAALCVVSPSDNSVTKMKPPALGHPWGGFARIWVPLTESTVPSTALEMPEPKLTVKGATNP